MALNNILEYLKVGFFVFSVAFFLFVAVQIIRILLGGSWELEVALLAMMGVLVTAMLKFSSDFGNTKLELHKSLAALGSSMKKDIYELKTEMHDMKSEMRYVKGELNKFGNELSSLKEGQNAINRRMAKLEAKLA